MFAAAPEHNVSPAGGGRVTRCHRGWGVFLVGHHWAPCHQGCRWNPALPAHEGSLWLDAIPPLCVSLHIVHMLVRELGVGVLSDVPLASSGVGRVAWGWRGARLPSCEWRLQSLFPIFSLFLDFIILLWYKLTGKKFGLVAGVSTHSRCHPCW